MLAEKKHKCYNTDTMLSYHARRSSGDYFDKIPRPSTLRGVWLHGAEVTEAEVDETVERHGLDGNIVRDIFDKNELPRIEYDEDKNVYMFLRVAWRTKQGEVKTAPFLAIAGREQYITLSQTKLHQPNQAAQKKAHMDMADTTMPLLYTLAAVVADYEQLVHETTETVGTIKHRLRHHEATNDDFLRFITIEENMALFFYNLTALLSVAERLHENRYDKLSSKHIEALEDVMLHIRQLRANVTSAEQTVASLQTVYSTISNNTLNQRMKLLTIVTLLVTVPNVFYGMYGMNVALPLEHEPWAYGAIVGFTAIVMLLLVLLVRKLRLL